MMRQRATAGKHLPLAAQKKLYTGKDGATIIILQAPSARLLKAFAPRAAQLLPEVPFTFSAKT